MSQLLMAENGGGALSFGSSAFMAEHAAKAARMSAALAGNTGTLNPMSLTGVHGVGLLGLGISGMGPGIGAVRPNTNVISAIAAGSFAGGSMADALLRDIAMSSRESVRLEQRQLAHEEAVRRTTPPGIAPGSAASTTPGGWGPAGAAHGGAGALPPGSAASTTPGGVTWPAWAVPAAGGGGGRGVPPGAPPGAAGGADGGRRGWHPLRRLAHSVNPSIAGGVESAIGVAGAARELGGGLFTGGLGLAGLAWWEGPHMVSAEVAKTLASARPAMDLRLGAFALGRAGGFSGAAAVREIFPGRYETPEWMKSLGLTPAAALHLVDAFGIAPTSAGQFRGMASALGEYSFLPGLSGVAGVARGVAAQAAHSGAIGSSESSIRSFGLQMSETMETAIAKGMDRASVMRSLSAAISTLARGGAMTLNAPGLLNFIMRFRDLPGGRTGEAGLQALSGLQSAAGEVGRQPLQTIAASMAFSNVKTPAQLRAFLGPAAYDKLHASPSGRAELGYYFEAVKNGDTYGQMLWGRDLAADDVPAQMKMLDQPGMFAGLPPELRVRAEAHALGMTATQLVALRAHPYGRTAAGVPRAAPNALGGNLTYYDSSKSDAFYKQGLLRMGVRPSLVDAVLRAGKNHNLDPLMLGAQMMMESSGGTNTKTGAYGIPANVNVMQIAKSSGMAQPHSAAQSINEAAFLDQMNAAATGGSFSATIARYRGAHEITTGYVAGIAHHMIVGGATRGGIPRELLQAEAEGAQDIMEGSYASMARMNAILPRTNDALSFLTRNAEDAANALGRIVNAPH
ncbi:MAG: hypothetical protein KGL52_04740 [Rhodospirillales bacterium]|nr:hypothetical protein [Rhodospirillales bacterium]